MDGALFDPGNAVQFALWSHSYGHDQYREAWIDDIEVGVTFKPLLHSHTALQPCDADQHSSFL